MVPIKQKVGNLQVPNVCDSWIFMVQDFTTHSSLIFGADRIDYDYETELSIQTYT